MSVKSLLIFGGGVICGLILGVWLAGPSSGPGTAQQAAQPVTPGQGGPDRMFLAQEVQQLEQIVANDPGNYEAWKKLGDNRFDLGNPQQSVEAYRKALEIDDSSPNVWTDMGIMYRQLGDFPQALASFEKAMNLNPNHPQSHMNAGVVYVYDMQDFENGIKHWEEFLRIQPSGPQSDDIRQRMSQAKVQSALLKGETGGEGLPADHPPLPGTLQQPVLPGAGQGTEAPASTPPAAAPPAATPAPPAQ